MTPHLKELKLIDMYAGRLGMWTDFQKFLPTLSYQLESTHFSYNTRASDSGEIEAMLARQPMSSEWSLWGPNVKPSLLQSLESMANVVTKLELYWPRDRFTCHIPELEASPTLIH
ncbi:hypothetical protein BGZ90_009985, partial [Linnemannia elongata]